MFKVCFVDLDLGDTLLTHCCLAAIPTNCPSRSLAAALLERFYDVDSGSVSIDGVDLRHLDPKWLRGRAIGYINQEPVLFATSIIENIRYGRPGATDQEVIEAAKAANADNFIRSFPSGYDTVLGECAFSPFSPCR